VWCFIGHQSLKLEKVMKPNQITYQLARLVLATVVILMLPLLAMQFTDQVVWTIGDFVVAGVLLFGTGLMYELVARKVDNIAYRIAVGVAVVAALLLVWINLAVGIIGEPDNPANVMYIGVLAVEVIGIIIARSQPKRMALALFATALAQTLVAALVLIFSLDSPMSGPLEILVLNGFFVVLFVVSALLFQYAVRANCGSPTGQLS
jgi:hypothetical protein